MHRLLARPKPLGSKAPKALFSYESMSRRHQKTRRRAYEADSSSTSQEVGVLSGPPLLRIGSMGCYVYPLNEVSAGAKAERVDLAANLSQKHVVFLLKQKEKELVRLISNIIKKHYHLLLSSDRCKKGFSTFTCCSLQKIS